MHQEDFEFLHLDYRELGELYFGLYSSRHSHELFKKLAFEVRDAMIRLAYANPEALAYFKGHTEDRSLRNLNFSKSIFYKLNYDSEGTFKTAAIEVSGTTSPSDPSKLRIFHASFEAPNAAVSGYAGYLTSLLRAEAGHRDAAGLPDIDGTLLTPCYDFLKSRFFEEVVFKGFVDHQLDGRVVKSSVYELHYQNIKQYLIQPDLSYQSPGINRTLQGWDFFDVVRPEQIYSVLTDPVGLAYFPSAVAALSAFFRGEESNQNVDVLQLNGRHFALASPLLSLHLNQKRAQAGLPQVGVLATTHDTNELELRLDSRLLERVGLQKSSRPDYNPHVLLNLFSDRANIVSKAVAEEITEVRTGQDLGLGRFFSRLAASRRFIGISNGIYLRAFDPRANGVLGNLQVQEDFSDLEQKKEDAKRVLFRAGLIGSETKPLFLYVGRLSWEKGIDVLALFATHIVSHQGGQVVIMGTASGGMPPEVSQWLELTRDPQYQGLIRVYLNRNKDQSEILSEVGASKGNLLRFAAEFTVVPSILEAFGLVGLEAFAMGSGVITSQVQGLKDLCKLPFSGCITFDRVPHSLAGTLRNMTARIDQAIDGWNALDAAGRQTARLRWIAQAATFDWTAPGGSSGSVPGSLSVDPFTELFGRETAA